MVSYLAEQLGGLPSEFWKDASISASRRHHTGHQWHPTVWGKTHYKVQICLLGLLSRLPKHDTGSNSTSKRNLNARIMKEEQQLKIFKSLALVTQDNHCPLWLLEESNIILYSQTVSNPKILGSLQNVIQSVTNPSASIVQKERLTIIWYLAFNASDVVLTFTPYYLLLPTKCRDEMMLPEKYFFDISGIPQ